MACPKKKYKDITEKESLLEDREVSRRPQAEMVDTSQSREVSPTVKFNRPTKAINIGHVFVAGITNVWGPYSPYSCLIPNVTQKMLSLAERKRRRHFSTAEREALYIASDGRCMMCDNVLQVDNWQPDHIIPFSRGGVTDVINGQSLCRSCNLKKGAKYERS